MSLHFHHYLDEGAALTAAFVSETAGTIDIDGERRPIRIVRYEVDDFVLELVGDTGRVLSVSRSGGEYETRLLGIRTGHP